MDNKLKIKNLLVDCKYMPEEFRDFHDQKDLFKLIHTKIKPHEQINHISWVDAHIYIVDIFLWFMAKRGYTLQKARHKIEFIDIQEEIEQMKEKQVENFAKLISAQQPITGDINES